MTEVATPFALLCRRMGRFLFLMYKGPLTFVLFTGKEKHLISKSVAVALADLNLPKRCLFQKTVFAVSKMAIFPLQRNNTTMAVLRLAHTFDP